MKSTIAIANELGYFPIAKQAKDIDLRAAYLYGVHYDGRPPRGRVAEEVYNRTLRQAIDDVMTEAATRRSRK
jgi:hypothetical protein